MATNRKRADACEPSTLACTSLHRIEGSELGTPAGGLLWRTTLLNKSGTLVAAWSNCFFRLAAPVLILRLLSPYFTCIELQRKIKLGLDVSFSAFCKAAETLKNGELYSSIPNAYWHKHNKGIEFLWNSFKNPLIQIRASPKDYPYPIPKIYSLRYQ